MRRFKAFLRQRQYLLLAVVAILGVASLFLGVNAPKVSAADCDDNAIIYCGFNGAGSGTIASNFIAKVQANNSGGSTNHHDLINIYSAYGLEPADYNKFVTSARQGLSYRDGRIEIDGNTVATGASSIGRLRSYQGNGPFAKTIKGITYYGNVNSQAFKAGTDSIPVTVLFDDKGVPVFAVMNSCGNPVTFTPVKPVYSCTNLKASAVNGQPGSFNFKTNAMAANGANITKLVYDFGDGKTAVSYNPNEVVNHVYKTSGNFHATVTVSISLPGGGTDTIVGADTGCDTIVQVALPAYECSQLAVTAVPDQQYKYQFVVTGKFLNGAKLAKGGANFTFGDGKTATSVGRANSTTATVVHTYDKDGSYVVTATMLVDLPNGTTVTVTSPHCTTVIKAAAYSCLQLVYQALAAPNSYQFTASANATQGAVLQTVNFSFGDGQNVVVQASKNTATTSHVYAANSNYTITATLKFMVGKAVKTDTCSASITATTVAQECKPGVAQGSPQCSDVCQYNASLPANSPECVSALPNTGAGDVIGIAGVVAVIGIFFYRQFIFRKHVFYTNNDTINMLLGEKPLHHNTTAHHSQHAPSHRNKQPLSHATYRRPHRFRPRSHQDR